MAKKFEKLVKEIGQSFSIPVNKLIKPAELKVYRLGQVYFAAQQRFLDLSEYYIDEQGDMFTLNDDTYFTKYGSRVKMLSNASFNQSGQLINTFRATDGTKITIMRRTIKRAMLKGELDQISFDILPVVEGKVSTKNFEASVG